MFQNSSKFQPLFHHTLKYKQFFHQNKYGKKTKEKERPGVMVHKRCQLKRWSKILESSETIASKSFSGFHSAIFTCYWNFIHKIKQTVNTTYRTKFNSNTDWKCRIPEKQVVYQIEAEKGALDMTHLFPYLTVKETELLQKIQNVKRFSYSDLRKWRGWSKTLSTVKVEKILRIKSYEMEDIRVKRGEKVDAELRNENGALLELSTGDWDKIHVWMMGREGGKENLTCVNLKLYFYLYHQQN